MAVRLKDIAREMGVSTVTVSKVLRGSKDVGETTRQKILKRMEELNYQPNYMARALASGRTYSIGLVVPDLVNPFFAEFAKALSVSMRGSGRALLLASSEEDTQLEQQEIRTLLSRGIDVLLIASCQAKLQNFYKLGEERTPYLLVDRNFPYLNAHFVGSNDFRVGVMATEHLIATGRKRIAHIGTSRFSTGLERLRGFREAMRENAIDVSEKLILVQEQFEETGDKVGYASMKQLLKAKRRPDAVFCYNDLTAIGAMHAAAEAGLRIPQDIAFVGCGNFRYADYLKVPLTTVNHSTGALGAAAGKLALALMDDPELSPQSVIIEPKLVVRDSTVASR